MKIGKNADIHPNAVIYDGTELGDNVTIRANVVLGAEGLDYGRNREGELKRIPHVSKLVVKDDVDVGSNTVVQKGILRPTIVGRGTKIGPNCDIGQCARLGKRVLQRTTKTIACQDKLINQKYNSVCQKTCTNMFPSCLH